jgi:hypothetical protein
MKLPLAVESLKRIKGELVKVKNLEGSKFCVWINGEAWITRWRECAGEKREWIPCSKIGCQNEGNEGGHVYTVYNDNGLCYIVPLCGDCNNSKETETFEICGDVLVPVTETPCEHRGNGVCLAPRPKLKKRRTP